MKKNIVLFILAITFTSCVESLRISDPAVVATIDNQIWRAVDFRAEISTNGQLKILAFNRFETLNITLGASSVGLYAIGQNEFDTASLTLRLSGEDVFYTTAQDLGNGQVNVQEINLEEGTATGTFRFHAVNVLNSPLGATFTNVQEGTFYKIPIHLVD
jgi:hypothetical protein